MKIEGQKGRPVFALEELNFGKMRDTFVNVDKYWYLGNKVKPYLALISNSFKVNTIFKETSFALILLLFWTQIIIN